MFFWAPSGREYDIFEISLARSYQNFTSPFVTIKTDNQFYQLRPFLYSEMGSSRWWAHNGSSVFPFLPNFQTHFQLLTAQLILMRFDDIVGPCILYCFKSSEPSSGVDQPAPVLTRKRMPQQCSMWNKTHSFSKRINIPCQCINNF